VTKNQRYLVAGLGLTGESVINFLVQQSAQIYGFDTREDFNLSVLENSFPDVPFAIGVLPKLWIDSFDVVVLSPGIAKHEDWVLLLQQQGKEIVGDIELFARFVNLQSQPPPVVAITGSNGKSTVTSLVSEVLQAAGYDVGMGGNIGLPALDLLTDSKNYDVFVLELSSFQLETTYSLRTVASTILNLSEDHMDRYESFNDYQMAKERIFLNTAYAVLPLNLKNTVRLPPLNKAHCSTRRKGFFSLNCLDEIGCNETLSDPLQTIDYFSLEQSTTGEVLCQNGVPIVPLSKLKLIGKHHTLNALATMALCEPFSIESSFYETVFATFGGLAHRTQWVSEIDGVEWINDSKGTNVGATVTAIESLVSQTKQLWLIAGGVSKEADFAELARTLKKFGVQAILFGRDAELISKVLSTPFYIVETLDESVNLAAELSLSGDLVLFSPACASFDQFKNYVHRGDVFSELVQSKVKFS